MDEEKKQIVLELISEVSGVEISRLAPETELVGDLGIDSPKALQMLIELETRFDIEIDDKEAASLYTVGDILASLARHT